MKINTVEDGYRFVLDLTEDRKNLLDGETIELGDEFVLCIKIPNPPINSAITPAFMEAFLELQRQLYQLSALQKKGVSNVRFLSEDEKRELDFSVIVNDGSSLFEVKISDMLKNFLLQIGDKMSGTQIAVTIISMAVLFTGGYCFNAYLRQQRSIKLEELKNVDHRTSLETIQAAQKNDVEKYEALVEMINKQGELGKKAIEVVEKGYNAIIKATSKTGEAIINDVHLDQGQAKALCSSARGRSEEESLILRVHVIDINTQDSNMISVIIRDIENDNEYKLQFRERLLQDMAGKDGKNSREKMFSALSARAAIAVELKAKIHDGDIRSVEFVKVIDD